MALPESVGGDGATLVDLTLVAEEIGRSLARCRGSTTSAHPAARPARHWTPSTSWRAKSLVGTRSQEDAGTGQQADPHWSIADHIVVRDGDDDVVRLTFGTRPVKVDNIGKLPMAWVDPAPPTPGWSSSGTGAAASGNTNARWTSGGC